MSLSVVIACLNEPDITETCRSIRATAGAPVEIIVVDDMSATPVRIDPSLKVKVIQNKHRCGVGPSRHIGVLNSTGEFILLTDAHMRFSPGWYETAMKRIGARPKTLHCATCVGIDQNNPDPATSRSVYRGATINFCGPDRQAKGKRQVFEACWLPGLTKDDAEIPAVMGACYFIPREWFLRIDPLRFLRFWGEDEIMLSVKTWLAGGDVRFLSTVRIGHKFGDKKRQPWRIPAHYMVWNKLFAIHTLCPDYLIDSFHKKLREIVPSAIFFAAEKLLVDEWRVVAAEQVRNRSIFVRDLRWLALKFGLALG